MKKILLMLPLILASLCSCNSNSSNSYKNYQWRDDAKTIKVRYLTETYKVSNRISLETRLYVNINYNKEYSDYTKFKSYCKIENGIALLLPKEECYEFQNVQYEIYF